MKSVIVFISCLSLSFSQSPSEKIKAVMQTYTSDGKTVGLSAGVLDNDSIVWTHSEGYSDLKVKSNFTKNTISRTASITKPMTAIAILQLVESGKLSIDDRVSQYVPEFKTKTLQGITIKHLLQHSSGLGAYKNSKEANNEKNYATLNDALQIFVKRKLKFDPGTNFGYTSYGYVVLGCVIESVSGMSYDTYLKKNIWDVAGMTQTSVEYYGKSYDNKATKYHRSKPGKFKVTDLHNVSDRVPGGGVQSTVEDLLKFARAVLNDQLITKASLDLMIENSGLKKQGNGYGLGWYLYGENKRLGNLIGHNGAQYGCTSFLFVFPESNAAVVVLSNTSGAMQEISNLAISLFALID